MAKKSAPPLVVEATGGTVSGDDIRRLYIDLIIGRLREMELTKADITAVLDEIIAIWEAQVEEGQEKEEDA